jgi:hypothetical protein
MRENDGQRRRDAQDGYAPFEVRPTLRPDPARKTSRLDVLISLLALVIIGLVFGACVAWWKPVVPVVIVTPPVCQPLTCLAVPL